METLTKREKFRVIICAFRKYTTLSAGTASVSSEERHFLRGLQTRAIPAGVSVYFLHFYNQYSSFVSFFFVVSQLLYLNRHLLQRESRGCQWSYLVYWKTWQQRDIDYSMNDDISMNHRA